MNPGAAEAAARAAVGLYAEASSSQSGTVGFAAAQLEEQQELERMDSVEDMVGHTFFEAVKMGNATTVEDFIARGLHVEQAEGSAGVAQRRCARGATALHYAAGNGHAEVVRLLVERGDSELNSLCSIAGGTPLMWAASQNRKDVVALLLAYGADPGRPVAPSMLQATWIRKTSGTPLGETALMVAAQYGHSDICRMLCTHSGSLEEIRNAYGQTALHVAALFGRSEAAAALLDAGSNPHIRDAMGVRLIPQAFPATLQMSTPLLLCAEHGHRETAFTLLWRGSNVGIRDFDGSTVSQVAACRGHESIAQLCDLWATGRLCEWSPSLHAHFPRAFRDDVRNTLIATTGSGGAGGGAGPCGLRNPLALLSDFGVLHSVFQKLLELHMVVPACPVGKRAFSEADSLSGESIAPSLVSESSSAM